MALWQVTLSQSGRLDRYSVGGFEVVPITEPIARQAALWDWEHRDPANRLIAATARIHRVELWHTDTVLEKLDGFPQRYFKGPAPGA